MKIIQSIINTLVLLLLLPIFALWVIVVSFIALVMVIAERLKRSILNDIY